MQLHPPETKLRQALPFDSAIQKAATCILVWTSNSKERPHSNACFYTWPTSQLFSVPSTFTDISNHSLESRHELDASKSKVLSKVTPVAECCISGTLNEPEFQKANSQHFLKTQPSKHPPTGLIKIKALRNWLLLLKILPITRTDWLTRKTELTGNHKKIHVLLCSRYLQCKLYSHS